MFNTSSAAVRRMAALDVQTSTRNPNLVVVVVATQALIRGIANMSHLQHEAMGGPWKTEYFESEEEARQWIADALN